MKFFFFFLVFAGSIFQDVNGQNTGNKNADYILKNGAHDTSDVNFLTNASFQISFLNPDSGVVLSKNALAFAKDLHFRKGEADALNAYGEAYHFRGDYPQALKMQFEALQINRDMKDSASEAVTLSLIGIIYNELGQYKLALQSLVTAITIFEQIHSQYNGSFELSNIGDAYYYLNMPDSAVYFQRKAYEAFIQYPTGIHLRAFIFLHMGNAYSLIGKKDSALKFYNDAIRYSFLLNDKMNACMAQKKVAELFQSVPLYDSALHYAKLSLDNAKDIHSKQHILEASNLVAKLYKAINKPDSAYFYLNISTAMRDSLYGPEKIRQMQLLMLDEQQKQTAFEKQNEQYRNRIRYIALLSGLGVFLLLALVLWRNNQHKKRSNLLLQKEKQNVEQAYSELKSTQAQLIQSEKMASLGELTAGIAHEIQNPLNFVNNFSEVNAELIEEMHEEMDKGNTSEAKQIAIDIKQNLEKINLHGKRADAIVKGMLQHSRASLGKREPTDINTLSEDYLKLAYHGFRAKDKTFNVITKTDFDHSIGKTDVVPQDVGRVILNLINNAFYAVNEKAKLNLSGYEPLVIVGTKKLKDKIEISVKDNGNGISETIKEKIFQPFFTTKPTGQGTGLGLSLSYDIIKAHSGEIKVETKEGEGTNFIISLPEK